VFYVHAVAAMTHGVTQLILAFFIYVYQRLKINIMSLHRGANGCQTVQWK
jgi:hypothetical protein